MKTKPLPLAVYPESQADLPVSCLTHLASHRTPVISVPLPELLFPASWAASDNVHPRTSANSPGSCFICFILLDSGIKRPARSEIREVKGSYRAVLGEEGKVKLKNASKFKNNLVVLRIFTNIPSGLTNIFPRRPAPQECHPGIQKYRKWPLLLEYRRTMVCLEILIRA